MGNGTSRVVGCLVPFNGKNGVDLEFLDPLDEGLGHSFCYVRPTIFESPAITPSNSERFTVDSSTLDSETLSGSFRHDSIEDKPCKNFPETTFKTISGASVSANVSTARTGTNQNALFASDALEPAASFEGTASFAAIPLQPVPRGSGPLNGFMSGPLERFASGPLDRGGGFMSGPIEKGVMSGPLDATDKSNFSAPLARGGGRRKPRLQRLMRSVSGPVKSTFSRTFSKHSVGGSWMQRLSHLASNSREAKFQSEASRNCIEVGSSEFEYKHTHNLQWAHGKAGEDRVHVVLSEEQGWLFIGIYDGFSGPDAPDFLMSHLYKFIDKELEGLLWDYEDNPPVDSFKPEYLKSGNYVGAPEYHREEISDAHTNSNVESSCCLETSCSEMIKDKLSNSEIVEENVEGKANAEQHNCGNPSISDTVPASVSLGQLSGQGRKSVRLYELLQMESWSEQVSEQGKDSSENREVRQEGKRFWSSNGKEVRFRLQNEGPTTSGENGGTEFHSTNHEPVASFSVSKQRQNAGKSSISTKIRKMYRKQKSLRKKLFPWSYDWHREETSVVDNKIVEASGHFRICKSGVDHNAVLIAMARALEKTEDAYMKMVENNLDKNPELALMGSCVLVMLMKDQDVYVMNLGDSRVILAQERPNDRHPNLSLIKDDVRHRNRSRESLVGMELDRISEESPMHNINRHVSEMNKNREISICRLKMRAVQLSTDHSTSIEEVCFLLFLWIDD